MPVSPRLFASLGPALALALLASSAFAQSPMPAAGGPPAAGEEEDKPEGIAETAPKSAGLLTTTPAVTPRRDSRKKFEVLRLDGYLRARGDWLKNLHLGFVDVVPAADDDGIRDDTNFGGAPFRQPLSCLALTPVGSCEDSITTSNLRLRLEPRIELTNTIAVHSQIDLLDNVVLGSTPEAGPLPLGAFGGNAAPADAGTSTRSSLVVRRAWAEVATALVLVKFGRMPDHFGLGIVSNSGRRLDSDYATWETMWMPAAEADVGGANRTDMDLDSDYGDTVDRASLALEIPGTPLRALVSYDWPAGGLTSGMTEGLDGQVGGQPWDLDDLDDISQWMIAIARMDAPADFLETMDRGEMALNFGARMIRRSQDLDYDRSGFTVGGAASPDNFLSRGLSLYVGNGWLKFGWKDVLFEAEGAALVGSVSNLDLDASDPTTDPAFATSADIRAYGGVARVSTKAFDDKLGYGLEVGFATGDDADAAIQGRTHLRDATRLPLTGDGTISRFVFDPDYKVDLILFRELIGAVSNAVYLRPRLSYALTKSFTFTAQNVTSIAAKPVSTPGNATFWGTEFDADLGYSSGGFQTGIAYGVLFPLGAMDHPTTDLGSGGEGFPFGTNNQNAGTAGNAHTFQLRLGVEF